MVMMISIRRIDEDEMYMIRGLDELCFGDDKSESVPEEATWWVAFENDSPVGFGGIKLMHDFGYLCKVGVLPSHRGHGLQKRFLDVRLRFAKRAALRSVITYTHLDNHASSNSLIAKGFRLYSPSYAWAGDDYLYWQKILEKDNA
jgi:ribosomal-protein-alanine N-acetyltransferase